MNSLHLDAATRPNPVRVGRYDVVGILGRGGMGTVYEAIDVEHGTRVALKTLKQLDPDALLRFKQEFRQVADLTHPNLVSLYELSCEGDLWFFTMEYVDGRDFVSCLGDRGTAKEGASEATGLTLAETATGPGTGDFGSLESGVRAPDQLSPAAIEQLREHLRQLVHAVRAVHDAGLLHLDIKPSNILVESTGRVVLLDFGIARARSAEDASAGQLTGSRRPVTGTPAWMSPEQHDGGEVGQSADWYAVGLVLYTALTGTRAFRTSGMPALAYTKRHVRPVPPSQLVDVPTDLSALAMALIHPDPARRPSGDVILALVSGEAGRRVIPSSNPSIVGRAGERERLRKGFDHASNGGCTVAQVRGPSGVGKSALLRDLRDALVDSEAMVLRGRCYERESVPYKAFDGMLDDLSRQLSARPGPQVDAVLPEWIGELARVFPVLAGVPAVSERLQASPPTPASVPASEIQRRAVEALRQLLTRLAAQRQCLVEIDDFQWADADSARALTRLLDPPSPPGLMVALSYRPAEAAENAAVASTLAAIDALGPSTHETFSLDIGPLGADDAAALALASLRGDELSPELARSIAHVSAGVPFLVEELANLVLQQIEAGQAPTVDLHDVTARRVAALVAEERALIEVLAIANNPVPISVAVSVAGIQDRGVRRALWSLRRHDFIRSTGARADDTIEVRHDRLREQVIALLTPERVDEIHLAIGWTLASAGPSGSELDREPAESPWLFDAVRHLNAAAHRLEGLARLRAARLDLAAGQKARRSAAFGLAFSCFENGARLLDGDGWRDQYELTLALHEGAADAAYLSSAWDAVAHHVAIIEDHARSDLDRLGAWEAQIDAAIARNEYATAVDAGCDALARIGVDLPRDPSPEQVGAAFGAASAAVAECGPDAFAALPLGTDPQRMAAMRIQTRITSAAYFSRPALLPVIACRMVAASVHDGLAPATPYALSIFGIVLNTLGMHQQAHAWGQVALVLMDRFEDDSLDARTGHVVHDLVCNYTVPLASTLEDVLGVYARGKALGDVEYAAYAAHAYVHNAMYAGLELEGLLEQAIQLGDFMRGHDQVNALHVHEPFEQLLRAWTGRTADPACLDGDGFSEADALAEAEAAGSRSAMCLIRVVMGIGRYNLGTPEAASELFEAARPYLDGMPSVWHTPMFHQYSALSILGLPEPRRAPLLAHVDESLEALRAYAAAGPMNFSHRVELVEAERARVGGDLPTALRRCEQACAGARAHHWPNDLGIALQIAAHCHEAAGEPALARRDLEQARDVFAAWGASAKARQLERALGA